MRALCVVALLFAVSGTAHARDRSPPAAVTEAASSTAALDAIAALSPRAARTHADFIERELRVIAVRDHRAGNDGDAAAYAVAERAYTTYLERFPGHANATEVRYGYAEVLYKIGRYDEAYFQYRAVVAADPAGRRAAFCASSASYAAQEMIKREPAAPHTGHAPITLSTWEEHYRAALEDYVHLYPDQQDTIKATYTLAYLLYSHNHFSEAERLFRSVIANAPEDRAAEQAANLILDTHAQQQDWGRLRDNALAFQAQQGLGGEAFQRELAEIVAGAEEKLAAP